MPALANDVYEDLFREHAQRNLERLSLYEPPTPPLTWPPELSPGKTQFEKLSLAVSYSLNKTKPPSLRSRLRHWVATWVTTWLGEIGALLGAPRMWDFGLVLWLLKKWSHNNTENINAAQSAQVFGGKRDINWQTSFLPFMESIGVYLRDVHAHTVAWKKYRDFKNGGPPRLKEEALRSYREAHDEVDQLAQVWGMRFFPVCDLIDRSPNGQPRWDGPYCGIFHTTEEQEDKPFFGLAFKGTNPFNFKDRAVDCNYQLIPAAEEYFAGTRVKVSKGVYTGLFGDFDGEEIPYTQILSAMRETARKLHNLSDRAVPAHVTGHSLGGSYSTLCYTQLLIDVAPSDPGAKETIMGDEYTFGAPRIGSNGWARLASELADVQRGRSWRIVNNHDLVPKVPPTTLQPTQLDFHHVDTGVHIWPYKSPAQLPTEIDQPNPKPYPIYSILYLIPSLIMVLDHRKL